MPHLHDADRVGLGPPMLLREAETARGAVPSVLREADGFGRSPDLRDRTRQSFLLPVFSFQLSVAVSGNWKLAP
jgi:hypothetical protein